MKKAIHPNWHHDCLVTCSCGNSFTTGSMNKTISVDICSACHPFFTGEMKFVDRQGRVDKFIKKRATAEAIAKEKKAAKKITQKSNEPVKSYKQILQEQQASLKQEKKATATKEVKAVKEAQATANQASEAVASKTVAKNS